MAGEGDKIRAGDASALEAAARRALADSQRAADITDEAREKLEAERVKLERGARAVERTLGGIGRGAGSRTVSSQANAERKRIRTAEVDEQRIEGRAAVDNTRQVEREKTEIVRKAARERLRIVEIAQKSLSAKPKFEVRDEQGVTRVGSLSSYAEAQRALEQYAKTVEGSAASGAAAVERAEERKTKAVREGERQRRLTTSRPATRVPPAPDLSAAQQDLMQQYVRAQQNGLNDVANELRKQLVAQKVLGANTIGNYGVGGPIPGPATKPSLGTADFAKQFERALKSPGFQFTPDPDRLAREMARVAGGVDFFPDELKRLGDIHRKNERAAHQKREAALQEFMRPYAEQSIAALPTADRAKLERAAAAARTAREGSSFSARQIADSALLDRARLIVGRTPIGPPPAPKVTYNPAFEREQRERIRAAREGLYRAGAGQYPQPIGPLKQGLLPVEPGFELLPRNVLDALRSIPAEIRQVVNARLGVSRDLRIEGAKALAAFDPKNRTVHLGGDAVDKLDARNLREGIAHEFFHATTLRDTKTLPAAEVEVIARRMMAMADKLNAAYTPASAGTSLQREQLTRFADTLKEYERTAQGRTSSRNRLLADEGGARLAGIAQGDPAEFRRIVGAADAAYIEHLRLGRGFKNLPPPAAPEPDPEDEARARQAEQAERLRERRRRARERLVGPPPIRVTDANRAEVAPTLGGLTHHLPEIGPPGIHREQGIDRRIYEQTGQQLPRSDVNLFTARNELGRIIGALESYAPFLKQNAEGGTLTRGGKPVWEVRENAVAVDPAYQRQGIATELFRRAMAENLDVLNATNETYTEAGARLVNRLKQLDAGADRRPPLVEPDPAEAIRERRSRARAEIVGPPPPPPPKPPPAPATPPPDDGEAKRARLRAAIEANEDALARVRAAKARLASVDPLRGDSYVEEQLRRAQAAQRKTLERVQLGRLAIDRGPEGAAKLKDRLAPTADLTRELTAQVRAAREAADAVEGSQERQTKAVEDGARKRTAAAKQAGDEGKKISGDAAEFERILRERSAVDRDRELLEAHKRYQAEVEAGKAPPIDSDEAAARAERERAIADARERARPPRVPPGVSIIPHPTEFGRRVPGPFGPTGGGPGFGPGVGEQIGREIVRAARAELARPISADPRTTALDRYDARRPGTDIIPHPTEFGRRIPGGRPYVDATFEEDPSFVRGRNPNYKPPNVPEDEEFIRNRGYMAGATGRFAEAESRTARVVGLSADQMHRHGLLTTEFLSALAGGRTTIREIGLQLGGTIAKFGGWTAAASLTYGGLAAISAVGQGAIASAEGVTSLRRVLSNVNTDQAQQQFRDLSEQFNLPVGDVTEAFFQSSKAFKSQDDAAKATAASLFAMKVGELDAGEAATFVTAAVRGFNLSADDLGHVVDVVNNLQNKFGASFGQTAKGVAAAAGAFGAAGGKVEELAAFVATGSLRTGRTGTEIATALRRTSEIVRRPERRARIIDLLGIDPQDSSITEILERAQDITAKNPRLGLQIATAISTPELASGRILPILQAQGLYDGLVDAARNAGGSAERELGVALSGIGERIKAIAVDLSRLGSALGQSGALDALGLMLIVLDKTLDVTTTIIEQFNKLPRPLRQAALIGAELLGTLALLRRFDLGASLGGRAGRFFARDPASAQRARVLTGLAEERTYVSGEFTRSAVRTARLTDSHGRALAEAKALEANASRSLADREKYNAAVRRAEDLEAQTRASQRETDYHSSRLRRIEETEPDFRSSTTRRALGAQRTVEDINREAYRTGALHASPYEGGRPSIEEPISTAPRATPPGTRRRKPRPPIVSTAAAEAQEALRDETKQAAAATEQASRRAQAVASTSAAAARVKGAALRTGAGLKNLGASLVSSIGVLDGIFLGLLGVYAIYQLEQDRVAKQKDRLKRIKAAPLIEDTDAGRKQIDEALHERSLYDRFQEGGSFVLRHGILDLPGVETVADHFDVTTQFERDNAAREAAAAHQRGLEDKIDAGRPYGRYLNGPQIQKRFQTAIDDGVRPAKALADALESLDLTQSIFVAADELEQALKTPGTDDDDKARAKLLAARERAKNLGTSLKSLARQAVALGGQLAGLTSGELTELNPTYLYTRGLDRTLVSANRTSIADLRTQLAGSTDTATSTALIEEIRAKQEPLEAEAEARRDRQLRAANGDPAQEAQARARYEATLRKLRIGSIRDALAANRRRETGGRVPYASAGNGLDQQLEEARRETPATADAVGGGALIRIEAKSEAIKKLENAKADNRKARKVLRESLRRERVLLRDLLKQADDAADESDAAALFDARTQVLAGNANAGPSRLALLIQRAGQVVQNALKHHARNSVEVLNAIAAQQQAQQELVDYQAAEIQSRSNLAAAYANTPGGEAAARIGGLEELLRFQRAHPKRFDANQNRDLEAQIIQARQDEAKRLRQEAEDLIASQYDVRRSRTDNPVQIARLNAQEAARRLRRGGFENPAERNRAIANRNSTRREYEEAIANRRLENAEYAHDIGKLSDEQYLNRLRAIQKTYEKGSEGYRRLKQQIGRFKHDLNNATELELTPGDIKLPTIGEIKRFIGSNKASAAAAASVSSTSVATNNANTFNINVAEGEAGKVWDVLETAGISVTSAARNKRVG